MRAVRACLSFAAALLLTLPVVAVRGDDADIARQIAAFAAADRAQAREEIAAAIASAPGFDRAKLRDYVNAAGLWQPLPSGRQTLRVELAAGAEREVMLRLPRDYAANKPWPLIYALHGTSGDAGAAIDWVERMVGERVEEFVVAAPSRYEEFLLSERWPPLSEHALVLRAVREKVNVDARRVLATGYSRGGHASWTLALTHPDLFAALLPVAGTCVLPDVDLLWEDFLPNVNNTRVLCVWGAGDIYGPDGKPSPQGGIAQINRQLRRFAEANKLSIEMHERADADHGDVVVPQETVSAWLAARQRPAPMLIRHTFRDVAHARAYWLEGLRWAGQQWTNERMALTFRDGEQPLDPNAVRAATHRAFLQRLGDLRGERHGQELRVGRKHLHEVVVWVQDDMVDWSAPVTVKLSGRLVFDGQLTPDLALCLSEALRSWDFDRLRWAGLHCRTGSKARVLTAEAAGALPGRAP